MGSHFDLLVWPCWSSSTKSAIRYMWSSMIWLSMCFGFPIDDLRVAHCVFGYLDRNYFGRARSHLWPEMLHEGEARSFAVLSWSCYMSNGISMILIAVKKVMVAVIGGLCWRRGGLVALKTLGYRFSVCQVLGTCSSGLGKRERQHRWTAFWWY